MILCKFKTTSYNIAKTTDNPVLIINYNNETMDSCYIS